MGCDCINSSSLPFYLLYYDVGIVVTEHVIHKVASSKVLEINNSSN